jgi:Spy/CpxP family protein refolding chaperone
VLVQAVEAHERNKTKGNTMKKSVLITALALGVSAWSLTAQDQAAPPPSAEPPPPEAGAPGSPAHHPGGFHLLPPRAQEQLNLTADQQKQVAALEAEVKAKLEQILTPEQLQQLKQMRPPGRPGGPGGGGPGGPGGPGGQGGENPPQAPAQQ